MGVTVTCDVCGQALMGRNYACDMLQRKIRVRPDVTVDIRIRVGVPEPGRGVVCHACVSGAAEEALADAMHWSDADAEAKAAADAQAAVDVAAADLERAEAEAGAEQATEDGEDGS